MALKFYLNDVEINVDTNSSMTFTQDKSLDGGSFPLEWNQTKNCIFPGTKLKIVNTSTNETIVFEVLKDEVEIISRRDDVKYLHHLSVTQNTHDLSKHLVRNTVFSQPLKDSKQALLSATGIGFCYYDNVGHNYIIQDDIGYELDGDHNEGGFPNQRFEITTREKINSAKLKVDIKITPHRDVSLSGGKHEIENATHTYENKAFGDFYVKLNRYLTKDATTPVETKYIMISTDQKYIEVPTEWVDVGGWYGLDLILSGTGRFQIDNSEITYNDKYFYVEGGEPLGNNILQPTVLVRMVFTLIVDTYYYSLWDVINTLYLQSLKTVNGSSREIPFSPLTSGSEQGQFLNSIVAPEFSFTGKDLFSCISEVFDYIDAVPVITSSGALGFEFLNEFHQPDEAISFADKRFVLSDEYYTNKLVSYYQNAKQPHAETYPSKYSFRRFSANNYGIVDVNDYYAFTPNPIESIKSVIIKLPSTLQIRIGIRVKYNDLESEIVEWSVIITDFVYSREIDITNCVFERSIYGLLPDNFPEDFSQCNQNNSLFFEKGAKSINVGGTVKTQGNYEYLKIKYVIEMALNFLYQDKKDDMSDSVVSITYPNIDTIITENLLYSFEYKIEYYGNYNGRIDVDTPDYKRVGETYVNQQNASVVLNRLGKNMSGLATMLGNEQMTASLEFKGYDNRLQKGTIWLDEDGNKWIANKVKITFTVDSGTIVTDVEFVKNFNAIAQYMSLDQEKRFYDIDNSLTATGYDVVKAYIYFSKTDIANKQQTGIMTEDLVNIITQTLSTELKEEKDRSLYAWLGTYNGENDGTYKNKVYIPLHVYGAGNSINFETNFESPVNAGNRIVYESAKTICKTTMYAGEDGFANKVRLTIAKDRTSKIELPNYPVKGTESDGDTLAEFTYNYFKKPNEIFHLSFSVGFLPYFSVEENEFDLRVRKPEEIYFGDNFISQNDIIPNVFKRSLKVYVSTSEEYTISSMKGLGNEVDTATINCSFSEVGGGILSVSLGTTKTNIKSWAICNQNDNILIATNQKLASASSLRLYFITRNTRLS